MCVSVNMESTTYRIHLAYQMLTTYGDKAPQHLCACVCVYVCVCVCVHACVYLSTWSLPPIVFT